MRLTPPDGPAAQLWSGSLIRAENSVADTPKSVERHRRGHQAGGGASTGGGSGLLPELPHASIGVPEVWRLQDVFDPDTIPKPIAASIATSDFYFCRLACSFRPERDETRIEWARFTLTLHPDDEGRRPIVFDLDPLEVADEVKHTRTVTIGPTMKFQQVDVSLGSAGFSFEYMSLTPEIWAAGVGEETAEWNFAQTRSRAVQGSKLMHALIKAPPGMTEVRAGLGIVADVASFGFLERLWGGPEKAGTRLPVVLWPRA